MSHSPRHTSLLRDLLAEGTPATFEKTLLDSTLRELRHRKRSRRLLKAGSGLAAFCLLGLLFWPKPSRTHTLSTTQVPACNRVATQSFGSRQVPTLHHSQVQVIASAPFRAIVMTPPGGDFIKHISGDELLALLSPRPAILLRQGPDTETLLCPGLRSDGAQDATP